MFFHLLILGVFKAAQCTQGGLWVHNHGLGGHLGHSPSPWGVIKVFQKICNQPNWVCLQHINFQWANG